MCVSLKADKGGRARGYHQGKRYSRGGSRSTGRLLLSLRETRGEGRGGLIAWYARAPHPNLLPEVEGTRGCLTRAQGAAGFVGVAGRLSPGRCPRPVRWSR